MVHRGGDYKKRFCRMIETNGADAPTGVERRKVALAFACGDDRKTNA
jgi:hypothetical protein